MRLNFGKMRFSLRMNYPYLQYMSFSPEDKVENIVYFHQK